MAWLTLPAGAAVSPAVTDTNAVPALSTPVSGDFLEVMLRMGGALIVVFTLLWGGVWFFKRSRLFTLYQGAPLNLRVVESRSIGFRNNLVVVAYNEQRFLLSVSATGVNLLTSLPDATEEEQPAAVPASPSFADQLAALARKN